MKKKSLILLGLLTIFILGVYIAFLFFYNISSSVFTKTIIILFVSFFIFIDFGIIFGCYFVTQKKREDIKNSFDFYVENLIATTGVGMISFNKDGDVIWYSKLIESRIKKNIIGKKITSLSKEFGIKYSQGLKFFRFELDGIIYETNVNFENQILILKDVSNEEVILKEYEKEKLVIGEMEIDNFQQFQVIISQEDIFKIQSTVINMFDKLVEEHNLVYRQYVNGKFIIITNQTCLNKLIADKFNFLDKLGKVNVIDGIKLSASIGIGLGSSSQKKLVELAKDGLIQAQSRGGDQITVMEANKNPMYYGSKSEITKIISRVKIKQTSEIFTRRLSDPEIKRVIVYGHKLADLDAVGSGLGIAAIAKTYNKEVYIQNISFDNTTIRSMESTLTTEETNIYISPFKANKLARMKGTLIVIVDTAEIDRVENPKALQYAEPEDIFIFDHHRVFKMPVEVAKENLYIDTSASSASEIVVEMMQFTKRTVNLSRASAQMLLNGIYLDTDQFSKSSSRTFQAASYLEKKGASSSLSVEMLKLNETESKIVNQIISKLEEVKPGFFISVFSGEVKSEVVAMAANEILRTSGRKASFVIAKVPNKKEFKLSARGIETNVQKILELVGGGGHFGASAAVSTEPLNIFKENVIQAIMSVKDAE